MCLFYLLPPSQPTIIFFHPTAYRARKSTTHMGRPDFSVDFWTIFCSCSLSCGAGRSREASAPDPPSHVIPFHFRRHCYRHFMLVEQPPSRLLTATLLVQGQTGCKERIHVAASLPVLSLSLPMSITPPPNRRGFLLVCAKKMALV